ncbi:MAG: TerC/Alx family metal homeostasis membrane protein [Candidatus Ancillula sp.]|nr:TerC/Alx family metal homeostasis membrane protein [Candidatus Ancillula sp.]
MFDVETSVPFEIGSILVLTAILLVDVVRNFRHPRIPSTLKSVLYLVFYGVLAIIFGAIIWNQYGHIPGSEFFAGWLTEYSLSIDNIFVFVLIMANFRVPRHLQKKALGVGIMVALVLRAFFIFIGGALIERFTWIFYLFGAFLIYTAIKLLVDQESDDQYHENVIVRFFERVLPMTRKWSDNKVRVKDEKTGKKLWTPMLIVFIALGVTDLFFAFDSIPAIFGLTKDPFIVLVANIFALMGLQQLFFLLGSAIEKLKFLPLGLSIVLAFIGVKLIFEALHDQGVEWAPEIHTLPSLMFIIIVVSFTATASILKIRHDKRIAEIRAKHATGFYKSALSSVEANASLNAESSDGKESASQSKTPDTNPTSEPPEA